MGSNTTIAGQSWTLETENYIPVTDRGSPSGVAPLNADGKIPVEYLDALYLSSTFVVADIAEMLALTTYKGNLVIVQDATADPTVSSGSATYAKINNVASPTLADFLKVEFGVSVVSVNGQTGAVSIEFTDLLTWGSSQTQFDTAVSNNTTVLQNVADILNLQGDITNLDNLKADKSNVLELDNVTAFTPTADYHPATKKYVDDSVVAITVVPGGNDGSVQVNIGNNFGGYNNFLYESDILTVPNIIMSSVTVDNTAAQVVVRDPADGRFYVRDVTSIGGGGSGHVIQDEGIPVTNRTNLNFTGNLVSLTDDSGNDRINVVIANPSWGDIGGTIDNQTDLMDELNAKADDVDFQAHIGLTEEHIDWTVSGPEDIHQDRLPPGAGGDLSYEHPQQTPATTWTIVHGLNKYPSVTTVDGSDNEIWGDLVYTSLNTCEVNFDVVVSGKAYVN